jgi:excisionase family DNA binding protein
MMQVTVLTEAQIEEIARQAAMFAVSQLERQEVKPTPEIMTKAELAEYLRCDRSKIERFMKTGLPYFYFGDTPRFRKSAVDEWLEKGE